MKAIQLVYSQSIIAAEGGDSIQELEFAVLAENFLSPKQITVHWAGDDNVWHVLPARYHFKTGQGRERWLARTNWRCSSKHSLPGTIRFALQCLVADREHWDNNNNANYLLKSDGGVLVGAKFPLAHLNYRPLLPLDGTVQPVAVAVHPGLRAKRVFVRWTADNWKTYHQTPCFLRREYCPKARQGRTACPDENNPAVWTGRLTTGSAARIEYAICCETAQGEIWDNNFDLNYAFRRSGFKVLTLNLHCYQEADQEKKFSEIARAIHELDVDIICLQEVGEEWNNGEGNWQSNAAQIIQDRLLGFGRSYHLYTDWSHIGFDRFREGSAILSKYRFLKREAAYVSTDCNIHNIHSRKVVMAQVDIPCIGLVNVYSVHLSWWKDGFWLQFQELSQWANEAESEQVAATLLCGDFNNRAGSHGYMLVASSSGYEDQFLRATSPVSFAQIFRDTLPGREKCLTDDDRIDFIFARKNSRVKPIAARVLFSGQDYKKVSDHPGYLIEFRPP